MENIRVFKNIRVIKYKYDLICLYIQNKKNKIKRANKPKR
jgi:hypothetical protein